MTAQPELITTVLGRIALTACGRRDGKTRSCHSCARKAPHLLDLATAGSLEALAAAICGPANRACRECRDKAAQIIAETGPGAD
ncbi:hypothetical protein [Streptomyces sp. bgisy060]|uniref:hypothetical protein n=1 Tax=Streptomyces sp. bgisy060 TaxID=3413775 RepID=UPI003EB8B116